MTPQESHASVMPPTAEFDSARAQTVRKLFLGALQGLEEKKMWSFSPYLTEWGRETLINQLVEAAIATAESKDPSHIDKVVESWWRTSLFVTKEGYWERLNDPVEGDILKNRAEIRSALGLPPLEG
jgi:hypothetical protein